MVVEGEGEGEGGGEMFDGREGRQMRWRRRIEYVGV